MVPDPDELVLRIEPDPGAELCLLAKKAGEEALHRVHLDLLFDEQVGEQPEPYERLLRDALEGDGSSSRPRTRSRRPGGSSSRCSTTPGDLVEYEPGSWGPEDAAHLLTATAAGASPGSPA